MALENPPPTPERRKGPDILNRAIGLMGVAGWLLLLIAMIIFNQARPEPETVTSRFHNVAVRTNWDEQMTFYIFLLMVIGLIISTTGLLFNTLRLKRKHDQIHYNLIALGLVSFVGIIFYLFI